MGSAIAPLAYNGEIIHERAEMLSLTDMWRAAGSPANKEPFNWARFEGKAFIEAVSVAHNLSEAQVIQAKKGKGGGTFAHWQVGLAYAKYLSPDFHMWCNTVVRERMEGTSEPSNAVEMVGLSDEVRRAIGGIVKSCAGVVVREALTEILPLMVEREFQSNARIAALEYVSVRGLLDEAKATIKGRGRLNRKVGWELRSKALLAKPPIQLRRCPHSGVWLFPREFAMAYMGERGMMLVLEHNEGQGAQKVIQFPRGGGKPKPVA